MIKRRPNLFIIGAPKCGTTTLAHWMSEHPNIFMSPAKEPDFFLREIPFHRELWAGREEEYDALFAEAGSEHSIVGEASTSYLHAKGAVPSILRYAPGAKFVVMLRNPVEMAPSLHEEQFYNLSENEEDFEIAWKLQEERVHCTSSFRLQYGERCRLGTQVERLLSLVPRERCHFIFLDDMKADPEAVYHALLAFLGVPNDGRVHFPVKNAAKERRSQAFASVIRTARALRRQLGFSPARGFGILTAIDRLNKRERPRAPLSPQMRAMLIEFFRPEVAKLENIFERDLGHWLEQ